MPVEVGKKFFVEEGTLCKIIATGKKWEVDGKHGISWLARTVKLTKPAEEAFESEDDE